MQKEIDAAIQFILSLLTRAKISKETIDLFRSSLESEMKQRFLITWDPKNPQIGNAHRALFTDGRIDPIILAAAMKASIKNVGNYLPDDFVIWVDPGCVSYRIGEHGNTLVAFDVNAGEVGESKRKSAYVAVKSQKVTIKQPPKAKSHSSREPAGSSRSLSTVAVK